MGLPGYTVSLYADGLENPRLIRTAPNGDLFVAETGPGRIRVLRGRDAAGKPQEMEVFAADLNRPFGIAFYPAGPNPQYVYVGNTDSVVRFPYQNGDLKARGPQADDCRAARSRAAAIRRATWSSRPTARRCSSASVRARTSTIPTRRRRKRIAPRCSSSTSTASGRRVYASGIRNPAGLAVHPTTGQIWVSVNERDNLGDNLVPDYLSHIEDGGFYGWPVLLSGRQSGSAPRGQAPGAEGQGQGAGRVAPAAQRAARHGVLQRHASSLAEHRSAIYAASHGSWNKGTRTGYKVIRVPLNNGVPTGEYQDFVTGFVTPDGQVWGRPVGVAVAPDGSLMVSDDGTNSIWQVRYTGK